MQSSVLSVALQSQYFHPTSSSPVSLPLCVPTSGLLLWCTSPLSNIAPLYHCQAPAWALYLRSLPLLRNLEVPLLTSNPTLPLSCTPSSITRGAGCCSSDLPAAALSGCCDQPGTQGLLCTGQGRGGWPVSGLQSQCGRYHRSWGLLHSR